MENRLLQYLPKSEWPDRTRDEDCDALGRGFEWSNRRSPNWGQQVASFENAFREILSRKEQAGVSRAEFDDLNSRVSRMETEISQIKGRGIEKTPGVCGGSARVVRTRIPIWTLESFRRMGVSESDLLESYPTLNPSDLVNSWSYVLTHKAEIDQEILENDDD